MTGYKRDRIYLSRDQLENVLSQVGVKVVTETDKDLLCYCPFHHNTDSPAFNMSKRSPFLWKCWNGKCNKRGNIFSLLTQKGYTPNEARRAIFSGVTSPDDFEELMDDLLSEDDEDPVNPWADFNVEAFEHEDIDAGFRALRYAQSRGVTRSAFNYFEMGYSKSKDMLIIPVFDTKEMIGVIGRSIEGKQYRYSTGLQRGRTIFNINNAVHEGTEIILTEGSLDAVYIWQAGYRCVGAVLGSAISPDQWKLIHTYFTDVVCFFDNDDAGIALTDSVIKNGQGLGISVVAYPDGVKDPGELSPDQIQEMIENRISSISLLLGE